MKPLRFHPIKSTTPVAKHCVHLLCTREYSETISLMRQTLNQLAQDPGYANVLVCRLVEHVTTMAVFFATHALFPLSDQHNLEVLAAEFRNDFANLEMKMDRIKALRVVFDEQLDTPLTVFSGLTIYAKATNAANQLLMFASDVVLDVVGQKNDPLVCALRAQCFLGGRKAKRHVPFQPIHEKHERRFLFPPPSFDAIPPLEI